MASDNFPIIPPDCDPITVVTDLNKQRITTVMAWLTNSMNSAHPLPMDIVDLTVTLDFSDGIVMVITGEAVSAILNRHKGPIN